MAKRPKSSTRNSKLPERDSAPELVRISHPQGGIDMTAREHAFDFSLPIDPRAAIRKIGKRILEAAENDKNIARKLDAIQNKLGDGRPLVGDEHSAVYERIKCTRAIPDIPTAPEWLRPLIAVAYLRAKAAISNGNVTNLFGNLDTTLDKILKLVDTLEPSFIGELLAETVLTARDDRKFARTLNKGASEFRALVDHLYEPDTDEPDTVAKAAAAGGGRGSCTCCRTVGGTTQCEACSCWIIVVIIIIIIVTK